MLLPEADRSRMVGGRVLSEGQGWNRGLIGKYSCPIKECANLILTLFTLEGTLGLLHTHAVSYVGRSCLEAATTHVYFCATLGPAHPVPSLLTPHASAGV